MCCCRTGTAEPSTEELVTASNAGGTNTAEISIEDSEPTAKWDHLALYANSAFDAVLKIGSLVPFAGKFCDLIAETKEAIEELKDTVDDAKDVIEWAAAQEIFFRAIVDTTCTDIESLALRPDGLKRDDRVVRLWDLKLANNVGVEAAQRAVDAVPALHSFSQVKLTVEVRDEKIVLAGTAPPSFEGWEKLDKTLQSSLDRPIDKALCSVAAAAWDTMEELKEAAHAIAPDGSSNESVVKRACELGRAELFKNQFSGADEAAMKAMSKLTEALGAITFVKVAKIERQVGVVEQKVDDLDGKGLHQKLDLLLRGKGISEADVMSSLPKNLPDGCEFVSYDEDKTDK